MRILRPLKHAMFRILPSVALLGMAGYFWTNTLEGDRGRLAFESRKSVLEQLRLEKIAAEAERTTWRRRVAALRTQSLDRDLLDERARALLNFSDPNDLILLYPPNQKLF
jgi:cell division protein FtsB